MTFGERIRNSRLEKNLTQKELAVMIGAKHNSVSNWENDQNKPDPNTIEILCGVLDISPSYLLSGKVDSDNQNSLFTLTEQQHIKKYRALDERGKEAVDIMLDTQYKRCNEPRPMGLVAARGGGLIEVEQEKLDELARELIEDTTSDF